MAKTWCLKRRDCPIRLFRERKILRQAWLTFFLRAKILGGVFLPEVSNEPAAFLLREIKMQSDPTYES